MVSIIYPENEREYDIVLHRIIRKVMRNDNLIVKENYEREEREFLENYGNIYMDSNSLQKAIKTGQLLDTKIIYYCKLDEFGINERSQQILNLLKKNDVNLQKTVSAIVVTSQNLLYTKSLAQEIAFILNSKGVSLIGKSLVEKVEDYKNFNVASKNLDVSKEEAFYKSIDDLVERLLKWEEVSVKKDDLNLLCIYSSHFEKSNTKTLWNKVANHIKYKGVKIEEILLENGKIQDCRGCNHNMCMHFAKEKSCYYGGYIVQEVYPKILEADALVIVSPNYNDSTGANITAFINRLTVLYKQYSFESKKIFAVIVSGYSGSDIIAKQLISSLNMNKGFILPPNFALMETANEAGEILRVDKIDEKAEKFANLLEEQVKMTLKKI